MAASYPTLNSPTAFTLYSPTEVYAYGAESQEDGIYSVLTRTRYNAAGSPLISMQKQLVSQLSDSLESKSISINERNLTSAQWSVYNAATKRTRYTSLPTSDITAATVSVGGFVVSQSDNAGVTTTRPLAIQKDGTWCTYGWDLTKNICELYGQHGYIRTNYTYTPYGAVTASGDVTQSIQWSSEFHDDELALVYYNYRHYNPSDGRWLGRDRKKEAYKGHNLYLFTKNNALRYLDYLGNVFVLPSHSTSGMPGAQHEHIYVDKRIPKSGCNIFICCKRVVYYKSAHCVIRFTYASGTVRGCRGGPSGNGPSNRLYNRGEGIKSNNQGTHCKGCCGSFGNVIAGCGEETLSNEQENPLQEGINSDIRHAQFWHDTCTLIKHAETEECSQIYNCIKKK